MPEAKPECRPGNSAYPLAIGLIGHALVLLALATYLLAGAPAARELYADLGMDLPPRAAQVMAIGATLEEAGGFVAILVLVGLALDGAIIHAVCRRWGTRWAWLWICLVSLGLMSLLYYSSRCVVSGLTGKDLSRFSGAPRQTAKAKPER